MATLDMWNITLKNVPLEIGLFCTKWVEIWTVDFSLNFWLFWAEESIRILKSFQKKKKKRWKICAHHYQREKYLTFLLTNWTIPRRKIYLNPVAWITSGQKGMPQWYLYILKSLIWHLIIDFHGNKTCICKPHCSRPSAEMRSKVAQQSRFWMVKQTKGGHTKWPHQMHIR